MGDRRSCPTCADAASHELNEFGRPGELNVKVNEIELTPPGPIAH